LPRPEIMHTIRQFACDSVLTVTLIVFVAAMARAQQSTDAAPDSESNLLAVLRSDAPASEKALTCKLLAIYGSNEAVSELEKLLSSWARIALEAIPGSAADEALRKAAGSLQGRLLTGTINSIGVRRDASAVDILIKRLLDDDAEVAAAAAVALGRIGNGHATTALRTAMAIDDPGVRSAVAEGCVLCAERLISDGKSADAADIYDQVRRADVSRQRIIDATRGAILSRNEAGIPLLIEQFRSPDADLFLLALGTAREFPGGELDQALADEMFRATPGRAALMIQAMADRRETVVLSAVLKAAEQGERQIRLSAIDALGRIGNTSCLSTLIATAIDADTELAQAAKATLAVIPDKQIDSQILATLSTAPGKTVPLLIEVIGLRRIEATDILLDAVNDSHKDVRGAALIALGETVAFGDFSVLISQVVAPRHAEDTPIAQQALRAASVRMPDREACAKELASAMERAPASTKSFLLETLGEVGGTTALATIGTAARSDDPVLQDVGSRLLGKWNNVDAAPVLLDLAKSAPETKYQIRALRGYIGIVRKFDMPDSQRTEMCQQALDVARRPDEQKLLLEVLKLYPCNGTLKLAIEAIQIPGLKLDATEATLVIAQKMGNQDLNISKLLATAGFEKVKLEIIKAEYGAGATQKNVTEVIQKQALDIVLITLPSPSYNTCFGGDPLPGVAKQLKIQYRINGRESEALFAENSPIILSPPK